MKCECDPVITHNQLQPQPVCRLQLRLTIDPSLSNNPWIEMQFIFSQNRRENFCHFRYQGNFARADWFKFPRGSVFRDTLNYRRTTGSIGSLSRQSRGEELTTDSDCDFMIFSYLHASLCKLRDNQDRSKPRMHRDRFKNVSSNRDMCMCRILFIPVLLTARISRTFADRATRMRPVLATATIAGDTSSVLALLERSFLDVPVLVG